MLKDCRSSAENDAVHLEIVGDLPDVDVADAAWYLALLNYVRNAIKYHDPRSTGRHVRISATVERDDRARQELVVRVADNGLGVPPERRDGLFTRFFRAHAESHKGTGLGLAIVRETIQALGGRTWAEFPESGSVFVIAVPYPPA